MKPSSLTKFAIIVFVLSLSISNPDQAMGAKIECDDPIPPNISTPGQATRYINCLESVINEMQSNLHQNSDRNAEATIDQLWQSFKSGDASMFADVMAKDTDLVSFGTDRAERWEGWRALEQSIKKQFASFNVLGIERKNKIIKYNHSGDTAWFSEVVDWEVLNGDQKAVLEGIRFTGVLENRPGGWVIVQFHTSVGVTGQVLEY